MFTSTLKPGLLVSMKTSIKGGVDYLRAEIERDRTTEAGERVAKWETTRTIHDPQEYGRAIQARGKARSAIISACNQTSFGLLCPEAREPELRTAIEVARIIADDFNTTAQHSTIEVYVITGRVAQNDVEAARAIAAEVRDLMEAMQAGIKATDATAIREAASKARALCLDEVYWPCSHSRKTTWLPRHRKMKPFPATAPQEKSHVRNWRSKGHLAPLMRPTKFPEIPVSLERNTEVFRHPLL